VRKDVPSLTGVARHYKHFGQNAADGEFQPDGLIETVDSSAGTFSLRYVQILIGSRTSRCLENPAIYRKIRDSKKLEILMQF
jgi:hypothetical protein